MYFIVVFVLCWIVFWWKADKKRLKEIYGAVVYTSFLGLLTDLVIMHYQLWSYNGLLYPKFTIPLSLDFGIYPVVAYLFVQTMPPTWKQTVIRGILWTLPAIGFEYLTLRTGNMAHHGWWNLGYSFLADQLIFLSIAGVYRFYRPAYVRNYKEV
ncbi:CBO0543 family protein [Tumebacillus permanentifrigoris]|uniref:Uncharacterized protein n=1 Tax=Tumebacillus permanentifrigoris TaxID=378543 RepID=A0A316D5M5_9BACL|nr:CBO0543 family protein [Tumebacillus permanentifrigoris]PWK09043.1 hypothetical protein C7459_114110 [Tumebacillus permanentifrigoris]